VRIYTLERVIENDKFGSADESHSEGEPAELTMCELLRLCVFLAEEAQGADHAQHMHLDVVIWDACDASEHSQVLVHRQVVIHCIK